MCRMSILILFGLITITQAAGNSSNTCSSTLPDLRTLLHAAFPVWNIDENGTRIEGGGQWNPLYYTKKYDGLDPKFGGYPTDFDVGYPFYYPAPFFGQPGAGTPHHCLIDAPYDIKIQTCPQVVTSSDNGPNGPGHIPPPITLAAVRQAYRDDCPSNEDLAAWFDFDQYQCLMKTETLLAMVRRYYPRDPDTGKVEYPSPADPNSSTYYELEFPDPTGSAHWCSEDYIASGHWADFCPYVHEGENKGKYQHPHISLVAVQQYLANLAMPDKCGTEWKSPKGEYPESSNKDTSIVFPVMESDDLWSQPKLPYKWPEDNEENKKKAPMGTFHLGLVLKNGIPVAKCDADTEIVDNQNKKKEKENETQSGAFEHFSLVELVMGNLVAVVVAALL